MVKAVVSASFLLGDDFVHGSIVASTRKCGDGALRIEEPGETAGPAVVFREIIDHRHVFEAARSQQCRSPDGNGRGVVDISTERLVEDVTIAVRRKIGRASCRERVGQYV